MSTEVVEESFEDTDVFTETTVNEDGKEFIDSLKKKYDPKGLKMLDKDDEWYFADTSYITNSHLKILKEGGPERLKAFYDGKLPSKKSDAYNFGSAFHCMILEPEKFDERFYVMDDTKICAEIGGAVPRNTTKYKEWKAAELLKLKGRYVLKLEEFKTCMKMAEKVNSIPEVVEFFQNGISEKIYTNTWNGIPIKIKVDHHNPGNFFLDVKSTRFPATLEQYKSEFKKMSVARQVALYAKVLGLKSVWILAVEKTFPYSVGLFEVSEETLALGWQEAKKYLTMYKENFIDNPELLEQKLVMGHI